MSMLVSGCCIFSIVVIAYFVVPINFSLRTYSLPRSLAAEAVTFCLDTKSNQRPSDSEIMSAIKKTNNTRITQVSTNASLRTGLSRTKSKKLRAGIVFRGLLFFLKALKRLRVSADYPIALLPCIRKVPMPCPPYRPAVFSPFARSLSADGTPTRSSPDAYRQSLYAPCKCSWVQRHYVKRNDLFVVFFWLFFLFFVFLCCWFFLFFVCVG